MRRECWVYAQDTEVKGLARMIINSNNSDSQNFHYHHQSIVSVIPELPTPESRFRHSANFKVKIPLPVTASIGQDRHHGIPACRH